MWLKYNGVSMLLPGGSPLKKQQEAVDSCRACPYGEKRNKCVFGEGPADAAIMFVGEGPGKDEDLTGRPFVGRAGKLLTKILEETGIGRANVYIANIVKCRPFNNENPSPESVSSCLPFLEAQISAIRPRVVVTLGKVPGTILSGKKDIKITREHGSTGKYGENDLLFTFHPSFLVRPNGAAWIEAFKDDLVKAARMAGIVLEGKTQG